MTNVTVQEALKAAIDWFDNVTDMDYSSHSVKRKLQMALSEIGKCEPVAEAIRERDRLGFAVVNVIGKLDEIIENTQEVEIDDFLHIAVPIDMWNELQDALEDMPKRADLYTSPQPIEKCEPVGFVIDTPNMYGAKIQQGLKHNTALYASPQPRECEDWQYFDKAYRKAAETSDATDWMNAALLAQQVRRKQLNTKD